MLCVVSCYACMWLPRILHVHIYVVKVSWVSVGYSGFIRYTGHPPPAGLRTSFFLDTRLQSCILSCSLVLLVLLLHPLVAPSCCTLVSLVIVLSCPLPFLFIYSI